MSEPMRVPVGHKGHYALVSPEDYERVSKMKWSLRPNVPPNGQFYAIGGVRKRGERKTTISMHRFILGLERGDGLLGDHINMDRLDNRRENLRAVTKAKSNLNRNNLKPSASGLKGAHKLRDKWEASIWIDRKRIRLGVFATPEEAHAAYCEAAVVHHGEYANFGIKGEISETP